MRSADCHPREIHYAKGLCGNCYMREFRRTHRAYRAQMKGYLRRYQKTARAKQKERERNIARSKTSEYKRWGRISRLRKYGLTEESYAALLDAQGNKCVVCNVALLLPGWPLRDRSPVIDHDHKTEQVRAILCNRCNIGLGRFRDSLELLQAATNYLQSCQQKGNQ